MSFGNERKESEVIIAAAIKFGDLVCHVPKPGRHYNVLHKLSNMGGSYDIRETEVHGFLTDEGEFLGRLDAMRHALASGQTLMRRAGGYDGPELSSEDLW
jgi:hypothetical protein